MSPRSLEEQFLANGGYYEKCKADTLFLIKGNPQLDKDNFTFSSDSKYPYFTRTVFNNGILGYVDYYDEDHLIKGNSIAVGMMGMQFFYMSHNFYAGQFTKTAFPLFEGFNEWVAQWFISWFNKSSKKFLSLLVRDFEKSFKETEIVVPRKANGDLAIDFIESLVRSYKDYHIAEVNEYLDAAGFEDCTLTIEEDQALNNANQGKVLFISRTIRSLMNGQTGDVDIQNKDINGKGCYFINSGVTEFGIKGKTDRKAKTFAPNTITIDFFGNAYYRPFEYKLATHNHVFSYSGDCIKNEAVGLYLVTQLGYLSKVYSYSNMGTMPIYNEHEIELPIDSNGSIDYTFMETYVRAIMKQTIGRLKAAMEIDYEDVTIEDDSLEIMDFVPDSDRFSRYLPLYDVAIACGALVDEGVQSLGGNDVDMEGWIDVSDYPFKPNEQMFVVHAKGESMLPNIHPGDLCVFELYGGMGNAGSREGQIVIARQSRKDIDYNCQYTIKEYHSIKDPHTGYNVKVELRPLNPEYPVIDIYAEDEPVDIIATLKHIL